KTPEIKILKQAKKELEEYFSGKRRNFDIPLDVDGSDFQKKVWNQLQKIPYGKTCAYKDIATKLRDPNASRAVGTANGKNPLWIVVPCHRVITASGSLGGYAGGLEMKTKLLQLESNINE
ncbi:MAG: methylated-DNA--[protein]-cysteine S-methyltransferase, partial [Bacteriovoracaceae bacterium]